MNRHQRRANRAADPERAKTQREIDALTPPGWAQRYVHPPWPRETSGCRSCGVSGEEHGPWATCILARRVERERVLLFTFAMLCRACAIDPDKHKQLADRAFTAAH